jgi:FtsP/CotA-like multicopper oxidase with cupredoxin domain
VKGQKAGRRDGQQRGRCPRARETAGHERVQEHGMTNIYQHERPHRAPAWLAGSAGALALLFQLGPAQAQAPTPPATQKGLLSCDPIIGKPLVEVPTIDSENGVLRARILLSDRQERLAARSPPTAPAPDDMELAAGGVATHQRCDPQYVRYFWSPDEKPPRPAPAPGDYADPLPGPTLRARVGDVVELTFINQINPAHFGDSIDRAENGIGNGCDQSSGGGVQQGYPANVGDVFPDCFHGSSTGNIHYHGTHTNPNGTGDNVFIEVRPSPRPNNQPSITDKTFEKQFDKFFAECEQHLKKNVLDEWPHSWNDFGPLSDPDTFTGMQMKLLQAYDNDRPRDQRLWPIDQSQYDQGDWPQYYIGAYPYCFRLPAWPPEEKPPAVQAGMPMGPMGPMEQPASLRMGQSPGTHWYHAHKHGSTAINVANGMTGVFIIEGEYDDALNTFYNAVPNWTRTQKVLVINQLGVSPNLELIAGFPKGGRIDKGPDFSVNGRLQPHIKMYPGEVQMWRIANTSGRSGAFFAGPPKADPTAKQIDPTKDFEWKQLAQDGVQFTDENYQKSLNGSFLMAAGNRVDLLVKAPTQGKGSFDVLVQHAVAKADLADAKPVPLITVDIDESGPEMQFIKHLPKPPDFLSDIADDEIQGTKSIVFDGGIGKKMTIDNQPFNGQVGQTVLLNRTEEWTIRNTSVSDIDHPFHIHINPFQVTEVFDPNEKITNPSTKQPVPKYVFAAADKETPEQCVLDPLDPDSWKPCVKNSEAHRIWWDVFPIPDGRKISPHGRDVVVPGYFKMRSRFVDYPGLFVMHCHILAHEDRGMMAVVEVVPRRLPYAHQ